MHPADTLRTYIRKFSRLSQMKRLLDPATPIPATTAPPRAPSKPARTSTTSVTYLADSDCDYSPMSSGTPAASHSGTAPTTNATEERILAEILQLLHNFRSETRTTQTEIHSRLSAARNIIVFVDSCHFLSRPDRYEDQVFIISELQNIAYLDTDRGGVQEIAQWCVRAWLQLLANRSEELPEVLTGLGHSWLLRAQQTLARIHRLEGSSSSDASSSISAWPPPPPSQQQQQQQQPQRFTQSTGTTTTTNSITNFPSPSATTINTTNATASTRAQSFTSSEDAREAARQSVEADARAGGPDYVEARGMLLPATEYFQRAASAAQRAGGRGGGEVLALAAEANISLGNVSYSHHSEQYFQQAVRYLQQASQVPGYRLSPYLQSYLDDFGRLLP